MLHDSQQKRKITESEALAQISTYMAENKIRAALEAEAHKKWLSKP